MDSLGFLPVIASGASADVLRLGRGKVLKLFHADVEHGVMQREVEGAKLASAEGLLVPRPIGWQTVKDRRGIIFEELDGRPLLDRITGWRVARARDALRKLAACHARIHQCGAEGLIHHQHHILHARIVTADADEALKLSALAQLEALPRGDRLCHGDFHPGNAIETAQGVAAVDWSNGCAGHPAGDVVRTDYLLRYGMYGDLLRRSRLARWFRHLAADFYLREYLRFTGMPAEWISAWRMPVALSCLGPASKMHRPALLAAVERYRKYHD